MTGTKSVFHRAMRGPGWKTPRFRSLNDRKRGVYMAQDFSIQLAADGGVPLYRQIYEYIRTEIRSGSLGADERLPSTRSLAANLHVARSTVEFAYSQLLSEGYIRAKKNSGYYVNVLENLPDLHLQEEKEREAPSALKGSSGRPETFSGDPPGTQAAGTSKQQASLGRETQKYGAAGRGAEGMIDFSLRHTEMSAFPYSTWKRIMREVMVDANAEIFSQGEAQGDLSLRMTIARYLHFSRGVRCVPDQVIVGAGNDYLFMLLRHILGEHRSIAMENPTYLRAARIFSSFGYRICCVSMDEEGMDPESVRASGADLVYAMPAHQFPMGCVMPVARRTALLRWAQEDRDRFIIEDDYDSEFRYRHKPIPALQSLDSAGRVIYIGTFSKVIAPAIRISYMILPPVLLEKYRGNCSFFSSTVSRIDQRILDEFMKNGHFERHLNRMRNIYRTRHDVLLEVLRPLRDRFRILGAGTGLHIVLEAEGSADETGSDPGNTEFSGADSVWTEEELVHRALREGVKVYPLTDFLVPAVLSGSYPTHPCVPAVILGFGALDTDRIREGVRRLSEAWKLS